MYVLAISLAWLLAANNFLFIGGLSHEGRQFIFNSGVGCGQEASRILVVGTTEEPVININISYPESSYTVPTQFATISSYGEFELSRSPDVPPTCAILVMSDHPVTLTLVLKQRTNVETMLILPVHALGMDYSVPAGYPGHLGMSRVGITATLNLTIVLFVIPHGASVCHEGEVYTGGQLVYIYPQSYRTVVIESRDDLTGAHILSSHPVAVTAGLGRPETKAVTQPESISATSSHSPTTNDTSTSDQQGNFCSIEMIPPKEVWGKEFICFPLPHTNTSYSVLSGSYSTTVTLHGDVTETVSLNTTGDDFTRLISEPVYITTSHPVLLTIYALPFSSATGNIPIWPSMMIVPPVEQWLRFYSFLTPDLERFYHQIIIVVHRNYTATFFVDFQKLISDWRMVSGSGYAVTSATMSQGNHHVYNEAEGIKFGLVAYGVDFAGRSYAHPIGMNVAILHQSCVNTTNVNDDGEDNDCDGVVDEEFEDDVDDDGDGLIDEDCFTVYRPVYTFSSSSTSSIAEGTVVSNQVNLSVTLLCLLLTPIIIGIVLTILYLWILRLRSKTKVTLVDKVNPGRPSGGDVHIVSAPRLVRVRSKLEDV